MRISENIAQWISGSTKALTLMESNRKIKIRHPWEEQDQKSQVKEIQTEFGQEAVVIKNRLKMKLEATVEDMRQEAIEAEREQEEKMDAHEYKSVNLANPNRKE